MFNFKEGKNNSCNFFFESGVLEDRDTIDREQDIIIIMSEGVHGYKWDCILL